MKKSISQIALLVSDYEEAIEFYTKKLNFILKENIKISEDKRWVVVAPPNSECSLLLAKASNEIQIKSIGNQSGGRVFLFLNTDNFERDHQNLVDNNIKIVREPLFENYGKVLVFEDLYGNLWDLIEPIKTAELFYSTAILKIMDENNIDFALNAIKNLKFKTQNEIGNLMFDVQQSNDDKTIIIIWECFTNEQAFNIHLKTKHLQDFIDLGVVALQNGYKSSIIK